MKVVAAVSLALVFVVSVVSAHTVVTGVTINGQTRSDCLRPKYQGYDSVNSIGADSPIMSSGSLRDGLMGPNYTCGFMPFAAQAASASCSVAAGSTISVSYYHGAGYGDETPEFDNWIARSHKGPFIVYMARHEASTGFPSGNPWFKIFQLGKIAEPTNPSDYLTAKWASPDTLNANNGKFTFSIPSDIAPGRYLLRTEIIALHDTSARGSQPYVRCMDLTVTGNGNARPTGVAIPGHIGYEDPGLKYNIYSNFRNPYPIPGPAVYVPNTTPVTTAPATTAQATTGRATTGSAPGTTGRATTGRATTAVATTARPTTGVATTRGVPDIGNCLTRSSSRAGCSVECISDCVCEQDPYCCRYKWDPYCVKEVYRFNCAEECGFILRDSDVPDEGDYQREDGEMNAASSLFSGVALVLAASFALFSSL